jgi:hypothetical protein
MVTVLGPYEALTYYIHTYIHTYKWVWSASRRNRFTSGDDLLIQLCRGAWWAPESVSYDMEKRKITCPSWESNPDSSSVQPVASRYTN